MDNILWVKLTLEFFLELLPVINKTNPLSMFAFFLLYYNMAVLVKYMAAALILAA